MFQTVPVIRSFTDENRFLSNFYPAVFLYNGYKWPHAEAAYQAMKSTDPKIHESFVRMTNPGEAKRAGKLVELRPDWERVKLQIMRDIVNAKFDQNPHLQKMLLATGYAIIEEGNTWGDTIWGICPPGSGIGDNALGVILMATRERLVWALPVDYSRIYAGIGSRETPPEILEDMVTIATIAGRDGWCLRSGGADGADSAFEHGAVLGNGARHIFLPWAEFNNRTSPRNSPPDVAFEMASHVHVRWPALRPGARSLIARNMQQILGDEEGFGMFKSKCVICWTPDGCDTAEKYTAKTGGTGSAIFLASTLNIPIFNLKNKGAYDDALEFMFKQTLID